MARLRRSVRVNSSGVLGPVVTQVYDRIVAGESGTRARNAVDDYVVVGDEEPLAPGTLVRTALGDILAVRDSGVGVAERSGPAICGGTGAAARAVRGF